MTVDINHAMLVRLQWACRVTRNDGMKDVEAVHELALEEGELRRGPANDLRSDPARPGLRKRADKTQRLLNHASWDTFAAIAVVRRFAAVGPGLV